MKHNHEVKHNDEVEHNNEMNIERAPSLRWAVEAIRDLCACDSTTAAGPAHA